MKTKRVLGMVLGASLGILLDAGSAQAATSCTGPGNFSAQVGLALQQGTSPVQSVADADVPFVFGAAECACSTDDVLLDVDVLQPFPVGTVGDAELWAGTGCDNPTTRTSANQTACQKITDVALTPFIADTASSSGHTYLRISARDLFSPVAGVCPTVDVSNSLYLLFFVAPDLDPSGAPAASCTLPLSEGAAPPASPTALTATRDGDAVDLSWTASADTTAVYFQVLCADADGNPVTDAPQAAGYSVCIDGKIDRRPLTFGGQLTGASPLPTTAPSPTTFGSWSQLDPRFVCSPLISATTGSPTQSQRITGVPGTTHFAVVAIDAFGNVSTPATVTSVGAAGSGCSTTAASSATALPLVLALGALMALHFARRLRARRLQARRRPA